MNTINCVVSFPVLAYAACTDYKSRIIPNIVPGTLAILATAELLLSLILVDGSFVVPVDIKISERILGIIVPAVILFIAFVIQENGIGGGDYKLILALGALLGLTQLTEVLFFTAATAVGYCIVKRVNRVPFATMAFIGYLFSLFF